MYKKYYKRFLEANAGIQNYACHGHHNWLDVNREAMLAYWDDSARLSDDHKSDYISTQKIPETQKLIAKILNLSAHEQIAFVQNTHEFVYRLLSNFDPRKKITILSTDSELYSFDQIKAPIIELEKIQTAPFDNFEERFIDKIKNNSYDMIFFSQVFFNSGMAIKNLKAIVAAVRDSQTMIVIDGCHGFMSLPTDLSNIESRVFYLSDSCKYDQADKGCCFLHVPKNFMQFWINAERFHFAKSTVNFAELYRLNAALNLFQKENLTVEKIHAHVQKLQNNFREYLLPLNHNFLAEKNILSIDYNHHGHFFAFAMPSTEHAKRLHLELRNNQILSDYRASKLRFSFGLYQNDVIDLSSMK